MYRARNVFVVLLFLAIMLVATSVQGATPIYAKFPLATWTKANMEKRREMTQKGDSVSPCGTYLFQHVMPFLGKMQQLVMFGIAKSDGTLDSLISRRARDVAIKESPVGTEPYVVGTFTDNELRNALDYDIYLPHDEYERVRACLRPRSVTPTRWA